MTRSLPTRPRLELAGLSFGGVLLAHWLAYVLAAPDPHERLQLLHRTGHALWPFFVALALGALMWGVSGFLLGLLRAGAPPGRVTAGCSLRLVAMQATLFLVLEAAERSLVEGSVAGLLTEPVVLIGLALQVVVAVAGALLLAGLTFVAGRLRRSGRRHRRAAPSLPRRGARADLLRPRPLAEPWIARGPPQPLRP